MLVLFTQDLQSSFFSFREEGLDLEGLSLRERKFDLRESLNGRFGSLGRIPLVCELMVFGGNFGRRVDKRPKMREVGFYL